MEGEPCGKPIVGYLARVGQPPAASLLSWSLLRGTRAVAEPPSVSSAE